jgi:hypothetical protein
MRFAILFMLAVAPMRADEDVSSQILNIKRVYVDRLTGGETAAQMRDLLITAMQNSKLFVLTENPERADTILRGAAEDLIYTDDFESSDSVDIRGGAGTASRDGTYRTGSSSSTGGSSSSQRLSIGAGEHEATNIKERKHEALATVRLVNKDGDVIWSTTQESNGAKFRGASSDVADKVTRQFIADYERLKKIAPALTSR